MLVLVSRPLLKGLSLVLDSEAFVFIWSCLDIGLGRLGIFFLTKIGRDSHFDDR